jgi:signal transduction histidine kinase
MSAATRTVVRAVVIAAGIAIILVSAAAFRLEDWPIYATYMLLAVVLFRFYVEMLPSLLMPMPGLAVTIGFLYVGGPPIILLRAAEPAVAWLLRAALPERWRERVPGPRGGGADLFHLKWEVRPVGRAALAAEWALFALGLGARWWIVSLLVPGGRPAAHPEAIVVAEIAGYACWGVLSMLPISTFSSLLMRDHRDRPVRDDLALITFALTPFVFLITYGYEAQGLAGAVWWSLTTLGLHFLLQRLNERRVLVEAQNRRLEALNRELEHRERLSAIGKMSSVLSHQILQQLGVIGVYADLIRHAEGEPVAALAQARANAEAVEIARRDVNRVLTDLLVFSKDLRLNLYEHPLGRLVEEAIEPCRAEGSAHGVSIRVEGAADTPVTVDKIKVTQALANVVRNAIEASPAGGEVIVRAAARDGWVEIAVADQGLGVPEHDREAVFTPFFTTREHGTGLGLAIAREFTEAHGGRLSVDTTPGPGATFVMRLPLAGP